MLEQEYNYQKNGSPLSYQKAVVDFEERLNHAYSVWKERFENEQGLQLHLRNLQMLIDGVPVEPDMLDSLVSNTSRFSTIDGQSGLSRVEYIPFGIDYYAENMPIFNQDFRFDRVGKVIVSDYTSLSATGKFVRKQSVGIFDLRDGAEKEELVGVRLFNSRLLGWRYHELRMQEEINSSSLRPTWRRPDTLATADQLHFFGNVLHTLDRDYYQPVVVERN